MVSTEEQKIDLRFVQIQAGAVSLEGNLSLPEGAQGIVAFAHGSGSSRHSPRNQYVAEVLQKGGLATLLFDLLTPDEERVDMVTRHMRFDIDLLSNRVLEATDWLVEQPYARKLNLGYFGASTGAAAALIAAAQRPEIVKAVVSRGGRPDLAGAALSRVRAPTLLIVGDLDTVVIKLNEEALNQMKPEKKLVLVQGATHLFEEPNTLDRAANLAGDWFLKYLTGEETK